MRRKERQVTDRSEIDAILTRTTVCRIGFAVEGEPYVVPLSYGYDPAANALFFHTAAEGRKIDCIAANPRVCFEVEGEVAVKPGGDRACRWGLRYESVIGYGTIREIADEREREMALRCIMNQQSGRDADWTFDPKVFEQTRVWSLDIESVAGKRSSRRDDDGPEPAA
jgi:nitroimidazol reductase NimA-like FMN-containing flavoprotein (pyridoxamine 5'-phosphate oxidase superfamily)